MLFNDKTVKMCQIAGSRGYTRLSISLYALYAVCVSVEQI